MHISAINSDYWSHASPIIPHFNRIKKFWCISEWDREMRKKKMWIFFFHMWIQWIFNRFQVAYGSYMQLDCLKLEYLRLKILRMYALNPWGIHLKFIIHAASLCDWWWRWKSQTMMLLIWTSCWKEIDLNHPNFYMDVNKYSMSIQNVKINWKYYIHC